MAKIRVEDFGGIVPRRSNRLLPNNFGTIAANTKLWSGELRAWNTPKRLQDFSGLGDINSVYRIPAGDGFPEQWLTFTSDDVDVVRAPLVNDTFYRFYWTGEEPYPAYNTRQRIADSDPPLRLGVPRPTAAPTVVATGGTEDPVTRFYTYTFVSAYGEEGQPSDVAEETGAPDGTWTISNMETTVPDAAERDITHKNIYRTVVGETTTAFFFVAQVDLADTQYVDTIADDEIALNEILESTAWAVPPDGLLGLVATANGYLAGFVGRDLYFSEPFRPHAWPVGYVVSTEYPIVGLGVFGNSIAVMTTSSPYVASGITPGAASFTRIQTTEPCVSKRSIVSTPVGVYYASDNGLVLVSPDGYDLVTRSLVTETEWQRSVKFPNLISTRYGTRYFATTDRDPFPFGFILDHNEPNLAIVTVVNIEDEFAKPLQPFDNLLTDDYDGQVYVLKDSIVYEWDPQDTTPAAYNWRSKVFEFAKPVNMGAALIQSNATVRYSAEYVQTLRDYNTSYIANGPLHPVNFVSVNGARRDVPLPTGVSDPPKTSVNGSPLFVLVEYLDISGVFLFEVLADNTQVFRSDGEEAEKMIRLPSTVKSRTWQFRVSSDTPCYSVAIAGTGKELATT